MNTISNVGKNLRRIRMSQNLSIFTVSIDLQMSYHNISNIERGFGNPSLKTLDKLANYYNIHIKTLFDEPT